jgi:polyisoprenoid-binding protein YceI
LAALAALGSWGCVQQAVLLPVLEPTLTALASITRSHGPTALVAAPGPKGPDAAVGEVRRYALRSSDSTLEVKGGDLLTGMHVMRFSRWRGAFTADGASPPERPSGRLAIEIELDSLDTDVAVDDSLRNHLLEVSRYPRAVFAGTLRPREDSDAGYVFLGRIVVHGVERAIRFYTDLRKEGDDYRIDAVFDMSRGAFNMHRKDALDLVIYDDFRVVWGLVAHPERASAEVIPNKEASPRK